MDDNYLLITNPDRNIRNAIIRKINANGGYCPSRTTKTPETKCRCKDYYTKCECICGLFIKIPCYVVEGE